MKKVFAIAALTTLLTAFKSNPTSVETTTDSLAIDSTVKVDTLIVDSVIVDTTILDTSNHE